MPRIGVETERRQSLVKAAIEMIGQTGSLDVPVKDIADTGCDIITIGQYLSPKRNALPVEKFYTPAEFDELKDRAYEFGLKHVESSPLVRSSYKAKAQWQKLRGAPL